MQVTWTEAARLAAPAHSCMGPGRFSWDNLRIRLDCDPVNAVRDEG